MFTRKTEFVSKLLTVAVLATTFPAYTWAAGGNSGGGGHDIEAGFKTKVLSIANDLTQMSDRAKSELKFDPDELLATLSARGRFEPLCATGSTLSKMRQEQKMARVYPEHMNVVNLDCEDYSLEQWKDLFYSSKNEDTLFFLHESLRILKQEHEDDYNVSSSYLKAARANDRFITGVISDLLFSNGPKVRCRLYFSSYAANGVNGELLIKLRRVFKNADHPENVYSADLYSYANPTNFISDLLNGKPSGDVTKETLYRVALNANCFDDTSSNLDPNQMLHARSDTKRTGVSGRTSKTLHDSTRYLSGRGKDGRASTAR